MKTLSGYETNGTYLKFKSGFTTHWKVEVKDKIHLFKTEDEADMHIITKVVGCEKAYPTCKHYQVQRDGCNNCKFGFNSNCANGGK